MKICNTTLLKEIYLLSHKDFQSIEMFLLLILSRTPFGVNLQSICLNHTFELIEFLDSVI